MSLDNERADNTNPTMAIRKKITICEKSPCRPETRKKEETINVETKTDKLTAMFSSNCDQKMKERAEFAMVPTANKTIIVIRTGVEEIKGL
ncbi:MAG: hypothetical protein WCS80_01515 [Bacilli bacterium]